jgi:hypothetical protein
MWKVILATLVIFGTGVITGGLLVNYTNHTAPAAHPSPTVNVQPESAGGQNPGRQHQTVEVGIQMDFDRVIDAPLQNLYSLLPFLPQP